MSDVCLSGSPLPESFFARATESVARALLGKVLVSTAGGPVCAGVIVETEAYLGSRDPGSHAATKGITKRNAVMFGPPGRLYVYFTYGNHHMLNLVTETEGTAGAVLIRAVEPRTGLDIMRGRRGGRAGLELTNGPGKLAQALDIGLMLDGVSLGGEVTVLDAAALPDSAVAVTGRIGLSQGHELPLRFYVIGNGYVSKGRTGPKPLPRGAQAATEETR